MKSSCSESFEAVGDAVVASHQRLRLLRQSFDITHPAGKRKLRSESVKIGSGTTFQAVPGSGVHRCCKLPAVNL